MLHIIVQLNLMSMTFQIQMQVQRHHSVKIIYIAHHRTSTAKWYNLSVLIYALE